MNYKTIFVEKTVEFLGSHMIGDVVTELIQGYVIGNEADLSELFFIMSHVTVLLPDNACQLHILFGLSFTMSQVMLGFNDMRTKFHFFLGLAFIMSQVTLGFMDRPQ